MTTAWCRWRRRGSSPTMTGSTCPKSTRPGPPRAAWAGRGQQVRKLAAEWTQCLAFSPDGKVLASGDRTSAVHLWDVGTGQRLNTLVGHTAPVHALAFAPDGRLASGGADGLVRLWAAPAVGAD